MRKNIVIFSDGTGQEGGVGTNTNVYELFNMIEDRTDRQISFYDPGLGTGWNRMGQISGGGITRNILECYQFLSDNFCSRDRIYLFGFSRGATTVRTLSGFIQLFGILPRSRPELVKRAWRIYKVRDQEKRRARAAEFLRINHTMKAPIRFLGAWDTVAALGLPIKGLAWLVDQVPFWRHSFHDLRLSGRVQYARHALAIDDERLTFHPQLWEEWRQKPTAGTAEPQVEPILIEDIGDIYNLAEKLQNPRHPVSRRLKLADETRRLLKEFDRQGKHDEPEAKVDALRRAIVGDLNLAVYNTDDSIYDRKLARDFEGLELSPETRERIASFDENDRGAVQMLDRLLIEEAYLLRSRTRPRLKQVWFAGAHTDVGGGYAEPELAHIPLLWMVQEAVDVGLHIWPGHKVNLRPDATGTLHDSRAGLGRLYRRRPRRWQPERHKGRDPLVHESVVARSRLDDAAYEPWILKNRHRVEPWPRRLTQSIQFDEHYLWREPLWGWNSSFLVPWQAIDRIESGRRPETITVYLKRGPEYRRYAQRQAADDYFEHAGEAKPPTIVIRGCLPRSPESLVASLESHLQRKRQEELAVELVRRQAPTIQELSDRIDELERQIPRAGSDATPDAPGSPGAEIAALRAAIDELKESAADAPPPSAGGARQDRPGH